MNQPVMIITGASRGIGAAAAAIAAQKGVRVVLAARNLAGLEQQASQIQQLGGSALVVAGDISQYVICQAIVRRTLEVFGKIDAVINNAAWIGPLSLVADMPLEAWTRTLQINLFGPMMLCRETIPHLRETNGRVVNISSGAAVHAIPGGSAYCISKAALNHFSRVLSVEEPSITVVTYDPGDVNTAMQAEIREKGQVEAFEGIRRYFIEQHDQGLLRTPEQAALAGVTLALFSPHEWSGEFIQHDEERMQELIRNYSA